MLTHVDGARLPELNAVLDAYPEYAVRPSALLRAYGTGRRFFNVWSEDAYAAVLARLEQSFFLLALQNIDYEEIAFFLEFNPYFASLSGEYTAVMRTASYISRTYSCQRGNLLRFNGKKPIAASPFRIERQPDLKTVYAILCESGFTASFDAWYADLSHRIRHGSARAYLIAENGEPACACLISAQSGKAGLISGVTTVASHRGHGLACSIVSAACADLNADGKIPVLECLDRLQPFYEKIGFHKIGETAELVVSQS